MNTKPTEAQMIEAVAKAIHDFEFKRGYVTEEWNGAEGDPVFRDMAIAVLTAVGMNKLETWNNASQNNRDKMLEHATIERCAQVAETLAFPYQTNAKTGIDDMRAATRKEIAAAIRALKGA